MYCHAHLVTGAPARQVILSSGSLFLSPPHPRQKISALQGIVLKQLQSIDKNLNLKNAPTSKVVEAVKLCNLQSFFLEWEDRFDGWQTKIGNAERLLLSDVQREVSLT